MTEGLFAGASDVVAAAAGIVYIVVNGNRRRDISGFIILRFGPVNTSVSDRAAGLGRVEKAGVFLVPRRKFTCL